MAPSVLACGGARRVNLRARTLPHSAVHSSVDFMPGQNPGALHADAGNAGARMAYETAGPVGRDLPRLRVRRAVLCRFPEKRFARAGRGGVVRPAPSDLPMLFDRSTRNRHAALRFAASPAAGTHPMPDDSVSNLRRCAAGDVRPSEDLGTKLLNEIRPRLPVCAGEEVARGVGQP